MNDLLLNLEGGKLASDGKANEMADDVIRNPQLMSKLVEGLSESDDLVTARTAHALERISRKKPELLQGLTSSLVKLAETDKVPMVRWHIAMILGNMEFSKKEIDAVLSALLLLLEDKSVFVKSWAMASLVFWGRRIRSKRREIAARIKAFQDDRSTAIRTRATKALRVLENENEPIPSGWIKKGNPNGF